MVETWTVGLPENFPVGAANALLDANTVDETKYCYRPPHSDSGIYTIGVKSTAGDAPSVIVKELQGVNVRVERPVTDNVSNGVYL